MEEMEFENIPSKRLPTSIDSKNPDILSLPNKPEVEKLSIWIIVRRYTGAFFIYLVYWLTLFGALKLTLGSNLSLEKARELVDSGVIDSVSEYGWGDHYILFFISFCFSTFCSAVLSGATAKKRGGIIASIANIPMLSMIALMCYLFYSGKTLYENRLPWSVVLPLSLISSCYLAIRGGRAGEQWQNKTFSSSTIFGIRPIHWWWLIFPLNLTILTLVPKILGVLPLIVSSTLVSQTKYCVLLFFLFVAGVTSIYFIIWGWYKAFRLLSANSNINKFRRALKVLFYLFGIPILVDVLLALVIILIRYL